MRRRVEARGLTPLADELKRIDELKTHQDVARYIGYSQRISVPHPFAYYVSVDRKNSSQYTGVHHAERPGHAGSRLLPVRATSG